MAEKKKPTGAVRKVRLTFTEEVLGSTSNDPDLTVRFMRQRKADTIVSESLKLDPEHHVTPEQAAALVAEEEGCVKMADDEAPEKMTVFPRTDDGEPFIWNYQLKGAFKDAAGSLRRVKSSKTSNTPEMRAFKKVIDQVVFVNERKVPYHIPEGKAMGLCQRPLRASTPQGERVALACSETVPAGSYVEFTVTSLEPAFWPCIEEWLNYLQIRGIGQWRNGGKGTCVWEYA